MNMEMVLSIMLNLKFNISTVTGKPSLLSENNEIIRILIEATFTSRRQTYWSCQKRVQGYLNKVAVKRNKIDENDGNFIYYTPQYYPNWKPSSDKNWIWLKKLKKLNY